MTNFYFYSPAAKRFASLPAEFITEVKDQDEAIFHLWSTFTGMSGTSAVFISAAVEDIPVELRLWGFLFSDCLEHSPFFICFSCLHLPLLLCF